MAPGTPIRFPSPTYSDYEDIVYMIFDYRDFSQSEIDSASKEPEPVDKDKRKGFKKFINPEPWKRK